MQREFLESILPDKTVTIWRRGSYGPKAPIDIQKWYHAPEDFEQIVSDVKQHSEFDVYVSPASYKAESRALENVDRVRTLWLDADTCELDNLRIEPTWKVTSSPGRWQAWWVLTEEVSATEAAYIVKKISYAHRHQGADVSSWAANKLMRIPGSVNSNHGFPVQVKAETTGHVYTLSEIAEAYADVEVSRPATRHRSEESNVEQPTDLPDYMTALAKLPQKLLKLATAIPKPDANRSDLRYKLLCDLFRHDDLSYDEVLSIAWGAPASKKWSAEDPRGINGLKFEADKAVAEVSYEREKTEATPRPLEATSSVGKAVKLLAPAERKQAHEKPNFIETYVDWANQKSNVNNTPYDVVNAWQFLSLIYGWKFYIPYENGDQFLNLYTVTLGQTTSGKSQSKKRLMKACNLFFKDDLSYNLGGNMSPEALASKLLDREDMASFINKDEVHGWLKSLVDPRGGYTTGLVEEFAELYDGWLPPVLRKSLKADSGKSAKVCVSMHLMGTPEEVIKVLTREMFKSGFLARFIWAVGNPRNVTQASVESKLREGPRAIEDSDEVLEQWIRNAHAMTDGRTLPIEMKRVVKRLDLAAWKLVQLVPETDANYDILNPALTRLGDTMKKCAALIALADGTEVVEMSHALVAIEHAETWAENLLTIGAQISASEFEQACDEIEKFVESRPGKRVSGPTLFNRFKARNPRDFKVQLESLEARGVLMRDERNSRVAYFINENDAEE